MRCLYREKKHFCGDYLEVDIFPVFEQSHCRGKRRRPTTETQKKLNQRNAERKLIRLLNTNFTKNDIRFDLTYDADHRPATPEEAQKEMQNFLRRLKRYRKKRGLPDLKYIAVTEIGKRNGRCHHHIIMNGGVLIGELAEIWGRGYTTAKPLQFNDQGIVGIAKYLIKEPILGKRWSASKNLAKPKVTQRDGRLSRRKVREWHDSGADNRAEIEEIYEGYRLSEISPYYNEINSGYYLTVMLCKKSIPRQRKGRAGPSDMQKLGKGEGGKKDFGF